MGTNYRESGDAIRAEKDGSGNWVLWNETDDSLTDPLLKIDENTGEVTVPHGYLGSTDLGGDLNANGNSINKVSTLTSQKNPWYDVTDPEYGAMGDGSTDDTAAIQAAIDAANSSTSGYGVVFFPQPDNFYKVTDTISWKHGVSLLGSFGAPGSLIKATSPIAGPIIDTPSVGNPGIDGFMMNISLAVDSALLQDDVKAGLKLNYGGDYNISNVWIGGGSSGGVISYGLWANSAFGGQINNITVELCDYNYRFEGDGTNGDARKLNIGNMLSFGSQSYGIYLKDAYGLNIANCRAGQEQSVPLVVGGNGGPVNINNYTSTLCENDGLVLNGGPVNISNVVIRDPNNADIATTGGVEIASGADQINLDNVIVEDTRATKQSRFGIRIDASATDIQIGKHQLQESAADPTNYIIDSSGQAQWGSLKTRTDTSKLLYLTSQSDVAWTDLDISSAGSGYVPASAKAVKVRMLINSGTQGANLSIRKNGHTDSNQLATVRAFQANTWVEIEGTVQMDNNGIIEYDIANAGTADTDIILKLVGYIY